MPAPAVCLRCGTAHWSRQPCPADAGKASVAQPSAVPTLSTSVRVDSQQAKPSVHKVHKQAPICPHCPQHQATIAELRARIAVLESTESTPVPAAPAADRRAYKREWMRKARAKTERSRRSLTEGSKQ